MLLHHAPRRTGPARWVALAVPIGLLALGFFERGGRSASEEEGARVRPPAATAPRDPVGDARLPESGALPRLSLHLGSGARAKLSAARERALAEGLIVQRPDDWVQARVGFEGRELPARVRLKGDWLDHVESDQWSLRVELDEPAVLGMRVFSIQAPSTVGYLWEWVAHRLMRAVDVLAPRSTFVDVAIDGEDRGVYFLQEHFAKELLESQGRREAAICRFDESTHWDLLLQNELTLPGPPPIRAGLVVDTAPVEPFGKRKLAAAEGLARGLDESVKTLRALRALAVEARSTQDRLRRLEALRVAEERDLDESLDVDALARFHAMCSLLQVEHGLFWHNERFAFDPVSARLEPVAFDLMAQTPSDPDPVPLRGHGFVVQFARSRAYYDGVFRHLGRLTEPGWLEQVLTPILAEAERFAPALPPRAAETVRTRLLGERDYLARVALPEHAANFAATVTAEGGGASRIELEAWATTRAPVALEGLRFENGSMVPAASILARGEDARVEGSAVVLPGDGRAVHLSLDADARLEGLSSVRDLLDALAARTGPAARGLRVASLWRPLASLGRDDPGPSRTTDLWLRPRGADWSTADGRPTAPTRVEVLERHGFLGFDPVRAELVVAPGEHVVRGDLVLPEGVGLRAEQGTSLLFEPDALLLATAPLSLAGTEDGPVVLAAVDAERGWGGVVVLAARERSRWSHVEVRDTRGITRGAFAPSGGVTFEESPVTLTDCLLDGSAAGDALNVIRADVHLEGVRFRGAASDAFDGDFVSGEAIGCVFERGGGDGVDLSGSRFEVRDSRFEALEDKALSAGEGTELEVRGGLVRGVSVGVASKDGSSVRVRGLGLEEIEHYALAAYTKKIAFGPARLVAEALRGGGEAGLPCLCELGSELIVDGRSVPPEEVDVGALYRSGVLGK